MHLPSSTDASDFTLLIIYTLKELSCNQQRRRRPLNRVPTGMHLPSPTDASAFVLLIVYTTPFLPGLTYGKNFEKRPGIRVLGFVRNSFHGLTVFHQTNREGAC